MAITRVQVAEGGTDATPVDPLATSNFSGSVTAGNLLVVFIRWYPGDTVTVSGVTDTLGTIYTQRETETGYAPVAMEMWSGVATASGTNAVSADLSGTVTYSWIYALEYSCGGTWAFDTSDSKSNSGVTDMVSNAFSTANAEELVVVAASENNAATYTGGADFTLIDGDLRGAGGVEQYVTSGTLASYVAHITSTLGGAGFVLLGAFKYTAAATGQFARPSADVADGSWTKYLSGVQGNNTDLFSYIDETTADDTDSIRSTTSPSSDTCTVGLSAIQTPAAGTVTMRIRARFM